MPWKYFLIVLLCSIAGFYVTKPDERTKTRLQEKSPSPIPQASSGSGLGARVDAPVKNIPRSGKTFSNDPELGIALNTIVTLFASQGEPSPSGKLFDEAVRSLEAYPLESIELIKNSLSTIPSEFEEGRRFLVQFATRLNVDEDIKAELLIEDLRVYREQRNQQEVDSLGPVFSFEFLRTVTRDQEILKREYLNLRQAYSGTLTAEALKARNVAPN